MYYIIEETEKNSIQSFEGGIRIGIKDFSYLDNFEKLIRETVKEDKLLTMIRFPDTIIDLIVATITEDKDTDYLKEKLTDLNIPLYSLIISVVNSYKEKYKKILGLFKDISHIIITATPNNLAQVVDLTIKLDKKVIIDGKNIPFADYQKILSNYDLNTLNKIKLNYQDHSSPSTLKEVYLASVFISTITKKIQKYNLSPLEKIIYVYDIVKSEKSKPLESNQKNPISGTTNHSQSSYYSNLFGTILVSLGINAMPIINNTQKYQRSFVYIKDPKYNIDGVYTFDPYADRKVRENYIDNYKYFALTPSKSQKEIKIDNASKTNISFAEILKLYEIENNDFTSAVDTINELEMLFNFIEENSFEEFNELVGMYQLIKPDEKKTAMHMYKNFIEKYNPEEIPISTLLEALYNTRMIEYYNNIVDEVDIKDMKEATKIRDMFQKFNCKELEDSTSILEVLKYSKSLDTTLNETISKKEEELVRKDLNIRLLKVLKKRQK